MHMVVDKRIRGVCWMDRWVDRDGAQRCRHPTKLAMAYLQWRKCHGSILAFLDRTHKWPKWGAWRWQMGPCGCLGGTHLWLSLEDPHCSLPFKARGSLVRCFSVSDQILCLKLKGGLFDMKNIHS